MEVGEQEEVEWRPKHHRVEMKDVAGGRQVG